MAASDELKGMVDRLSQDAGLPFRISDTVVPGTSLLLVYADKHPLPERYSERECVLGFRVPTNCPDVSPEDSFFIMPVAVKLLTPDPVRQSLDIHRAGKTPDHTKGILSGEALVFSWHIWDRVPWNRRKHTLQDHYRHALRRFEAPENG